MREEQWIPLGLVTVPRPCKRGVIGLVDAGQEFNRQEGSLQMFTDSNIFSRLVFVNRYSGIQEVPE